MYINTNQIKAFQSLPSADCPRKGHMPSEWEKSPFESHLNSETAAAGCSEITANSLKSHIRSLLNMQTLMELD